MGWGYTVVHYEKTISTNNKDNIRSSPELFALNTLVDMIALSQMQILEHS